MKLTEQQLKQIIKEELEGTLSEDTREGKLLDLISARITDVGFAEENEEEFVATRSVWPFADADPESGLLTLS